MKLSHGLIAVGLALGSCRSREAFLYSCAPADATRHQRINQVMTLYLLDHLDVALASYAKRCGGYPQSLEALLPPAPGTAEDCDRSGAYLDAAKRDGTDPDMTEWHHAAFVKVTKEAEDHGYRITYRALGRSGTVASAYEIAADPVERDKSGFASYWMSRKAASMKTPKAGRRRRTLCSDFRSPAQERDEAEEARLASRAAREPGRLSPVFDRRS